MAGDRTKEAASRRRNPRSGTRVPVGLLDRPPDGCRVVCELLEIASGLEDENSAVPVTAPGCNPRSGVRRARFLQETLDATRRGSLIDWGTRPDVPEAGLRVGGDDSEHRDPPGRRLPHRLSDRGGKTRFVSNDVVRGEDHQDRIVSFANLIERFEGGGGDGRGGVPGGRLEQNGRRLDGDGLELLRNHETVLLVADHDGTPNTAQGREPADGGLQQGVLVQERDELLGMELPGERPEPASGTARQDDGEYGGSHLRGGKVRRSNGSGHSLLGESEAVAGRCSGNSSLVRWRNGHPAKRPLRGLGTCGGKRKTRSL